MTCFYDLFVFVTVLYVLDLSLPLYFWCHTCKLSCIPCAVLHLTQTACFSEVFVLYGSRTFVSWRSLPARSVRYLLVRWPCRESFIPREPVHKAFLPPYPFAFSSLFFRIVLPHRKSITFTHSTFHIEIIERLVLPFSPSYSRKNLLALPHLRRQPTSSRLPSVFRSSRNQVEHDFAP